MGIEIKSRWSGNVIYTAESAGTVHEAVLAAIKAGADLYGADLYGANLSGADLSGADLLAAIKAGADLYGANLSGANLSGANLYGADLYGADLYGANLSGADLYGADLSGANLSGANLYGADLSGANLSGSNLYGANLYGANLSRANLSGANLSGAKNAERAAAQTVIAAQGELRVWKKLREGVAELRIPAEARRSNASGRKCRAEYAVVVSLPEECEVGHSMHDDSFEYRVGETVRPRQPWCEDRWQECASGIHFYITREEAEAHT